MKKLFPVLFMLLFLVAFCACSENKEDQMENTSASTTETTTTEETTAEETTVEQKKNYLTYNNQAIVFDYPNTMIETDLDGMECLSAANGNSIGITSEAKNNYYATMTVERFKKDMKPIFEPRGIAILDASVERKKNANGIWLTVINCTTQHMNSTIKNTLFIITVGYETYTVTVVEVVDDATLAETVFNTLNIAPSEN